MTFLSDAAIAKWRDQMDREVSVLAQRNVRGSEAWSIALRIVQARKDAARAERRTVEYEEPTCC